MMPGPSSQPARVLATMLNLVETEAVQHWNLNFSFQLDPWGRLLKSGDLGSTPGISAN